MSHDTALALLAVSALLNFLFVITTPAKPKGAVGVWVGRHLVERLKLVAEVTNARDMIHVISRALAVYESLHSHAINGYDVRLVRGRDGAEKDFVISEFRDGPSTPEEGP